MPGGRQPNTVTSGPVTCVDVDRVDVDVDRAGMDVDHVRGIGAGEDHLRRTSELADAMAALCHARHVPFIATTHTLANDATWTREALADDGAHPGCGGYQRLTDIVLAGPWREWISHPRPLLMRKRTQKVTFATRRPSRRAGLRCGPGAPW